MARSKLKQKHTYTHTPALTPQGDRLFAKSLSSPRFPTCCVSKILKFLFKRFSLTSLPICHKQLRDQQKALVPSWGSHNPALALTHISVSAVLGNKIPTSARDVDIGDLLQVLGAQIPTHTGGDTQKHEEPRARLFPVQRAVDGGMGGRFVAHRLQDPPMESEGRLQPS